MHIVTFNGSSTKKPKRPEAKTLSFEDAAIIGDSLNAEAAYTLDPDFDSLGTPATFQLMPGVVCTADGGALQREGWLDAA